MIFTSKDGELRLLDGTASTGPYYMEILFVNSDLNFPVGRGRPEENLILNRGNADSNAQYSDGPDDPILEGLPFTASLMADDTVNTQYLVDLLSGVTVINGKSMTTTKGTSTVTVTATSAVSTPAFADTRKTCYNAEILYDGSNDLGYRLKEIYFNPMNQTINEGVDSITINLNGMIHGNIERITAFSSGTTIQN
ncbi:MAG: hypothetical protein FK734_09110 [Asgard group archaeon]|nr:hypothetical protein [Asgard group archaeon]